MPSDKSASLVRRLLSGAFIFACTSALAGEPSLLTSISGLWQFAEINVWIQIDEKGAAYQCRIGREGTVFSASGSFISPNSIEWKSIWGTDTELATGIERSLLTVLEEFPDRTSNLR
jgi:hypothetical protein